MSYDESNLIVDQNLERKSLIEMIKMMNIEVADIESATLEELQNLADRIFDLSCVSEKQTSIEELFPEACKSILNSESEDRQITIDQLLSKNSEKEYEQITILDYFEGKVPYISVTFNSNVETQNNQTMSLRPNSSKRSSIKSKNKNQVTSKSYYQPFNKGNSRVRKDK